MNVITYRPWSSRDRIWRPMNPQRHGVSGPRADQSTGCGWLPAVDVREDDNAYHLSLDIPGVDPAQVSVQAVTGVLSVSGERKLDAAVESDSPARSEHRYGSFQRRFNLPDSADIDNIQARSKHGVLMVTVPKLPALKPRRITVGA